MASRPYATTARSMSAMHVKVSATVVVALCSGFRHLKRMRTVLPTARIHIAVENELWYKWNNAE